MKKMGFVSSYIKVSLFVFSVIIAYLIFYERNLDLIHNYLLSLGYFGTFLAGTLYTYGFTSAPATAILLILANEQNIFLAGLIGGLGSVLSDLLIFNYIRFSFAQEIMIIYQKGRVYLKFLPKYFTVIIAVIIIASPLPDEIGVSLLAFNKKLSLKYFSAISYILNTIGITIILFIGQNLN